MKKISYLLALLLLLWSVPYSPTTAENPDAELFLEVLDILQSNNPRGTLMRKGVKYKWELVREGKKDRYQVNFVREKGGQSNLVYSTTVMVFDKRSAGEGYIVKMYYSVNESYKWSLDPKSYLEAVYKGNEVKYTAAGQMASFESNDHGLTDAQLKTQTAPDPSYQIDEVRYMAATARYMAYKYHKLFKP
jgi:hypothetical protein